MAVGLFFGAHFGVALIDSRLLKLGVRLRANFTSLVPGYLRALIGLNFALYKIRTIYNMKAKVFKGPARYKYVFQNDVLNPNPSPHYAIED